MQDPVKPLSLRAKRCLFTHCLSQLIAWIEARGWLVAVDETRVFTPRRVRIGNALTTAEDAVHLNRPPRRSKHYDGLAADLLLYDDLDGDGEQDDYVERGDDPRWLEIGRKWESLHPSCTSGLRFGDANHVSWEEVDRSTPL